MEQQPIVAKVGEKKFTMEQLAALVKADYDKMQEQRARAKLAHEVGTARGIDLRIAWLRNLIYAKLWGQLATAVFLGKDPPSGLGGLGVVAEHIVEQKQLLKEEAEMEAAREKGQRRRLSSNKKVALLASTSG